MQGFSDTLAESIPQEAVNPKANAETVSPIEDTALYEASLSAALVTIFRGKFCDALLHGRRPAVYNKEEVLYEVGDKDRTFFFIRHGFVKVGTIVQNGHEIIYDIRKDGDVVGELCAGQYPRRDRAVALEQSHVVLVPYLEIVHALQENPDLLTGLVETFTDCLSDAYEQVNTLALRDIVYRLSNVLVGLASKIGRPFGEMIQIPIYLTQEDISQMVAARRERVSSALNLLRRRGIIHYSNGGHLLIHLQALENIRH